MIRLETTTSPQVLRDIVSSLKERSRDPRYDSICRALLIWINRVVVMRFDPAAPIPELDDLKEESIMLADNVLKWTEQLKHEGMLLAIQQGMQRGKLEGRLEGEAAVLERLLTRRFGPLTDEVQAQVRARLYSADAEQLERKRSMNPTLSAFR